MKSLRSLIDAATAIEWFKAHPVPVKANPLCPSCQAQTIRRVGRFGHFFGCCRFPHCRGRRSL